MRGFLKNQPANQNILCYAMILNNSIFHLRYQKKSPQIIPEAFTFLCES